MINMGETWSYSPTMASIYKHFKSLDVQNQCKIYLNI